MRESRVLISHVVGFYFNDPTFLTFVIDNVMFLEKGSRLFTVPYFSVGFSRLVRFELPPSWFITAKATWGECLNYLGEHSTFRAEKRKKHARTLRARGAPKVSKMAVILIFPFSTNYYATKDIPVSSDNYPTQEDSCRCNLALVRFSYSLLNFKKDFKALDAPAAYKQIPSTGLLLSWTFFTKSGYISKPLNI